MIIKCKNCKKEVEHHAKGFCTTCYKKLAWKPELKECKRCNRILPIHAKGLCNGCYTSGFHLDSIKLANYRKFHNVDIQTYKKITQACIICGFSEIVDLHHLDRKKENNSETNLIGLCPNHHRMIHDRRYSDEIQSQLKQKGYNISQYFKSDSSFR